MSKSLIEEIRKVEQIGGASKIARLLRNPVKYLTAIGYNRFVYAWTGRKMITTAILFYGKKMVVGLPASTDIYLTGGKSHASEIRLAKFMILNLKEGDYFLDIGAHYGYFSMLALELIGDSGKVLSFEPASESFELLQHNVSVHANAITIQKAVSDVNGSLVFYEFPNQYSEYNSADISQFEQEEWFKQARPRKVEVPSTTINEIVKSMRFKPTMIKIDVEGGELGVMRGGLNYLATSAPIVAMEYLEPKRNNESHKAAVAMLRSNGYKTMLIDEAGKLRPVDNIDSYLESNGLESDNVVFVKD
jgi:FkbM family methyltransferase